MNTSGPESGSVFRWAAVFYLILAVAGVVWLGFRHERIDLGLFVALEDWPVDLALGLAAGGLLAGGWEVARRLLPQPRVIEEYFQKILGPLTASEALVLATLSALAEELFFRGAVQDAFGLLIAVSLFTLLHLGPGREFHLWTVFAAVAGLVLGGLMAWREALLAPIVAHAVVNGIGLLRLASAQRILDEKGTDA